MEKIIAVLRNLSSDLDNISKRMDTIENNIHQWDVDFAKWETKRVEIETSIQKLTEQYVETTTRLDAVVKANIEWHEQAETRIDALEHAVPDTKTDDVVLGNDDAAFLDSLLSASASPTKDNDNTPTKTHAQEDAPTDSTEETDTSVPSVDAHDNKPTDNDIPDILKLNDEDWERVRPSASSTKSTRARARKSVSEGHTNVELRAYARQYMIEVMNAKAEQLRDPMAIVKTMETDEFKSWVSER